MVREFIGWETPLCESVPRRLLASAGAGLHDLRSMVVVVPTRQSSWRLRAALPLAAAARGAVLLGPEFVTPPVLLNPPATSGTASSFLSLLAWNTVLDAADPDEFSAFLGRRAARPTGTGGLLPIARRLQELRRELADGGLSIAQVAAGGEAEEERDRWNEMAELEQRHAHQLAVWGRRDMLAAKLEHAAAGSLPPTVCRVVLAAVPDPPKLLLTLLENWEKKTGGEVELLVAAPPYEAESFDAWGRPDPDVWARRPIPLQNDDLWLEATPDDQAARIARAVASGMAAMPPVADGLRAQIAIGVPDREAVAPLQRELAAIGLPAFDPKNRPVTETALFRLVQALLDLRGNPGYAETAALLRHPDILASVGGDTGGVSLLAALDKLQAEHLPVTLDDLVSSAARGNRDGSTGKALLFAALERVRGWRAALCGGSLAGGLRAVLQDILAARMLRADDPADAAFQEAAADVDEALRELDDAAALEAGSASSSTSAAAGLVLLARLREGSIKAVRREEDCVDLEGWLELAWNPAPLLFVAGMNEGLVPDGHVGDIFLPDALRRRLGLRDDRLRVARDAHLLTSLLAQRSGAGGRVVLVVGKTSNAGDPLRPSRLLFRCADEDLAGRARHLFREPPPSQTAAAYTISFKLDPARLPPECVEDRRLRQVSPTIFRDYLACPLRFYLRHFLRMEPLDDRAREPDARDFGNLVHDALDAMAGEGRGLWGGDGERLARWLEEQLRRTARQRYGLRPWLGVELAVESAVRRLHAFAHRQAEWHREGWGIIRTETKGTGVIGGMELRGRIDRIDRHAKDGRVCVLDYKTTDKARTPSEVHFGPVRPDDSLIAAVLPYGLGGRGSLRWADLQLPLYCEMLRAEFGPEVVPGYVLLPKASGETDFVLWENYTAELHTAAMECALAVAERIKAGTFWPPGKIKSVYSDDFASLLFDNPSAAIEVPVAPRVSE